MFLNPKDIAILRTEPEGGAGADVVLMHLLKGFAGQMGSTPVLICRPGSFISQEALSIGLPLIHLPYRSNNPLGNIRASLSVKSMLGAVKVVHAWHSRDFEAGWFLARRLAVPATGTMHDPPACIAHSALRRGLIKLMARRLDQIVMVSSATMKAWEPYGVCANNCTVIHNGLADQCDRYHKTGNPDPVRIGFLGMYSDRKGFPVIKKWIKSKKIRAKWILYGRIAEKWQDAANQLSMEYPDTVKLAGHRTCMEIFHHIDILVHPSTCFDPFPTALLEAAQFGLPVVASNAGGTCEIVQHGKTGFVYDMQKPHDGLTYLEKLSSNADMRETIGNNARALFTSSFKADKMVECYCRFFDETLTNDKPGMNAKEDRAWQK